MAALEAAEEQNHDPTGPGRLCDQHSHCHHHSLGYDASLGGSLSEDTSKM